MTAEADPTVSDFKRSYSHSNYAPRKKFNPASGVSRDGNRLFDLMLGLVRVPPNRKANQKPCFFGQFLAKPKKCSTALDIGF